MTTRRDKCDRNACVCAIDLPLAKWAWWECDKSGVTKCETSGCSPLAKWARSILELLGVEPLIDARLVEVVLARQQPHLGVV